ncbi:hypothetical protein HHI36_008385 [Cryptolaemus montrouzieri]|uniref:Uncharacterized protein n=1 Tax=Cryptolaemus montrouzieri TaxID=559131 RepID=A0ABD2MSL3_9CUCU
MEFDVFIEYLISGIPDAVTFVIGHSTLKDALSILVSSLQFQKCNLDVMMQLFEFVSVRLMEESSKNSSMFSSQ